MFLWFCFMKKINVRKRKLIQNKSHSCLQLKAGWGLLTEPTLFDISFICHFYQMWLPFDPNILPFIFFSPHMCTLQNTPVIIDFHMIRKKKKKCVQKNGPKHFASRGLLRSSINMILDEFANMQNLNSLTPPTVSKHTEGKKVVPTLKNSYWFFLDTKSGLSVASPRKLASVSLSHWDSDSWWLS